MDMSGHPAGTGEVTANRIEDHPFFSVLETIVQRLDDGLDHPEIWKLLAEAAQHDDVHELNALVNALRPGQSDPGVRRAFDTLAVLLHTLAVDRTEGLAMFAQLVTAHQHSAMVAGAAFFAQRLGDPEGDLSQRFCEAPFIKFETLIDGTVAPCCSIWTQHRLGHLDGNTAEAIWNSPAAQAMRESILDGSYRYCNKQRCTLIMEDALPKRDAVTDPLLRSAIDEARVALAEGPRWLFLAHDVTCNLACPSCRSGILAADEAQEARFDKIQTEVFQPLLASGQDVTLSVSGQGDPWSSPHYRSILRYLADNELTVTLNIHTNALLMSEARWAQYQGLDRYRALVDVSIDACTPWVYERVRRPGKWDKLYPNLQFIAAKRARSEFREFHLNATIQLDNFHEMPALMDLATELGADSMRLYMVQNTGGHIAADYTRLNVADAAHPLHLAFLETLRDPKLGLPIAHLYDVGVWRARALEAKLPSDTLRSDSREALADALIRAAGDAKATVALCAAGRIRFPNDGQLLLIEAGALDQLGFGEQAGYRRAMAEALCAAAA